MRCKECNNEVQESMNYCPYCSCDLTNQTEKPKKNHYIIIKTTIVIIIVIIISSSISKKSDFFYNLKGNKTNINDMVKSVCRGDFDTIYTNKKIPNQGIYQCKNNNYVYYLHDTKKECGYYKCGEIYELGYTYHENVEEVFPNAIYFYRESRDTSVSSELKIAVEASSEDELIDKYAPKFYGFIKNINKNYNKEIQLFIFFNETLDGINTTYNKLFLMIGYNTNNVTQSHGMGTQYGEYALYDGDPYDLLNTIFSDKKKYEGNGRNAIKNNRNIIVKINDGKTITYEKFLEQLKNSFNDPF